MLSDVEQYFQTVGQWEEPLRELGRLANQAGLTEAYKWKHPCYTYNGKNVLILGEYKDCCLMTFFKGVILKDPKKLLVCLSENTQGDRVLRFDSVDAIKAIEDDIIAYIKEAIEVEVSGQKVPMKSTEDYEVPQELLDIFEEDQPFKEAFYALTPGRQRGYLLHYAGAKQSKTRVSRIEKSMPRVHMGKGINDCICGLSKRMPRCDGSHKQLRNTQ